MGQVVYEQCPKCAELGKDTRRDNLGVYRDGSKHCYSCGYHVFPKHYTPAIAEPAVDSAVLPPDFTREVPADAWKWLLKYGLGYRYWLPFVGWSQKHSRLILTVGEPIEFSIGRYIEVPGDERVGPPRKWNTYGNCHKTPHIFGDYSEAQCIVLVEDLISAHKVSQVAPCIPLFGTNVFGPVVSTLKYLRLPIAMWLDADQQGAVQSRAARLSVYTGLPCTYLFSDKDPKELSFDAIKRKLAEV